MKTKIKIEVEKTGTTYKCYDCGYIFDWEDDACPNCGDNRFTYYSDFTLNYYCDKCGYKWLPSQKSNVNYKC